MIKLSNVAKYYSDRIGEKKLVFRNINLEVGVGEKVGLLGLNGAGKTTLCKILAGSEPPSSGKIFRPSSTSWPIGIFNSVDNNLTGEQNIKFICMLFDVSSERPIKQIGEFSGLGNALKYRVSTYSAGMRAKLAFFLAFSFEFDFYIVDEATSVGDATFKEKANQLFKDVTKNKGLLLCSHSENLIRKNTDYAYVLNNQSISEKLPVELAIELYKELSKNAKNN